MPKVTNNAGLGVAGACPNPASRRGARRAGSWLCTLAPPASEAPKEFGRSGERRQQSPWVPGPWRSGGREPRFPRLDSHAVLVPQAPCGDAATRPTAGPRLPPGTWGAVQYPLVIEMLVLDRVEGGTPGPSTQQTASEADPMTLAKGLLRSGTQTMRGLRLTHIRGAIVFD